MFGNREIAELKSSMMRSMLAPIHVLVLTAAGTKKTRGNVHLMVDNDSSLLVAAGRRHSLALTDNTAERPCLLSYPKGHCGLFEHTEKNRN